MTSGTIFFEERAKFCNVFPFVLEYDEINFLLCGLVGMQL